jgi:hypothetical protein
MCLAAAAACVGLLAHSTALRAGQQWVLYHILALKSIEIEINVRESTLYN